MDASTIQPKNLLLERWRKLSIAMRFDQHWCDLKAAESLDLVLR
jgi:hypothetical protein